MTIEQLPEGRESMSMSHRERETIPDGGTNERKGALYTDIKKTDVCCGLLPSHWLLMRTWLYYLRHPIILQESH